MRQGARPGQRICANTDRRAAGCRGDDAESEPTTQRPETLMTDPRPDREFADFLAQGRFIIQRSRSSGRYVLYLRVAEPVTGARDLEWVEASGKGIVNAVTVIPQRPAVR